VGRNSIIKDILKLPFFYMILTFVFMDFANPFLRDNSVLRAITSSLFFISCDVALGNWRLDKNLNFSLILIVLLSTWLNVFVDHRVINTIHPIIAILFLLYSTYKTILIVLMSKVVDLNVVFGSITGYLLFGYVGALLMLIVELLVPGSFTISQSQPLIYQFIYFSFITITSLGYGDILPVTETARSVAAYLSIGGQLYLSILVAIIVGKYMEQKQSKRSSI
jgi:voltage-gated potassium channel